MKTDSSYAKLRGRRPNAVAGLFYPNKASDLLQEINRAFGDLKGSPEIAPKAVVAPHAGYAYSGPVAASAFAPWRSLHGAVERVVVIGPSHRFAFRGVALPAADSFASPLGDVSIDLDAARELLEKSSVLVDPRPHAEEHCVEVEVPFLQHALGDFRLVPLVVGDADAEAVAAALKVVWGGPETRIVVSSDLSHFLSYDEARRIDAETVEKIVDLEGDLDGRQACGARALNGMALCARRRGLRAEALDVRNSGDTAGGRDRVVGYAAIAYQENP